VAHAGVMMEAALSMRTYTVSRARQAGCRRKTSSCRQSVARLRATEIMNSCARVPGLRVQEAALNPTNPRDRAVEWEADIVNTFATILARRDLRPLGTPPLGTSMFLARLS